MKKHIFFALLMMLAGTQVARAGVQLGATRVIYPEQEKSVSVSVMNGSGDKPYLVQASVKDMDLKRSDAFEVLPPLFRLETKGNYELRIIKTATLLPKDRESLNWLSVQGIASSDGVATVPGSASPLTAQGNVSMGVGLNIKLIYRPSGLAMGWRDGMAALKVTRTSRGLHLTNPSPYYMSFVSVEAGTKKVMGSDARKRELMLAPFASEDIDVDGVSPEAKVKWRVLNDYGAVDTFTGTAS
ncbi:molecular chaperone [Lelliottia nimipressuralis]|uniref:fimbrial biogenesis chaperone n=1 Tax=Lelliottia nimipressuralis TaxID=69220 RepID=UPI0035589EB7